MVDTIRTLPEEPSLASRVSSDSQRLRQRSSTVLFWIIAAPVAVVIAAFVSVTLLPAALGWQSFVVTSASMTPNIPVGAVVVVRSLGAGETMKPGDVGTFDDPAGQLRVTHRVIEVLKDGSGVTVYRTRGDAVIEPDGELRRPEHTVGAVVYTVPAAGWIPYYLSLSGVRGPLFAGVLVLLGLSLARTYWSAGSKTSAAVALPPPGAAPITGAGTDDVPQLAGKPAVVPAAAPLSQALGVLVVGVAVFAVGLATVTLLPLAWDWHPFTMPDTSMEPAVPTGALVMTEAMAVFHLAEGDVIVFMPARERGKVYVRRVVSKEGDTPGSAVVRTKGENLPDPDPFTLEGTVVVGRMVYAVPAVGGWLALAGSREGFFLVSGLVLVLLVRRMMTRPRAA